MIVNCKYTDILSTKSMIYKQRCTEIDDSKVFYEKFLTINKKYLVYGILIYNDNTSKLLIVDDNNEPLFVYSILFEVIDNKLLFNSELNYNNEYSYYSIGFGNLSNFSYVQRLMNKEYDQVKDFLNYKNYIEELVGYLEL